MLKKAGRQSWKLLRTVYFRRRMAVFILSGALIALLGVSLDIENYCTLKLFFNQSPQFFVQRIIL